MKYLLFLLLPLTFASATESTLPTSALEGYLDSESAIPSRAKRIYALEQAGLIEEAAKMDELDQDMLYYRAKNKSKKEFAKLYPGLAKEKLEKFQSLLREKK